MDQRPRPPVAGPPVGPGGPLVVRYCARDLLGLCLLDGLLTAATLGLYLGWAKTRVRRYLWGRTKFAGESFRYTGSGAALLLGYGLALAALVPLLGALNALPLLGEGWAGMALLANLAAGPVLAFAAGFASFCARRYLLSHTRWCGVRLGLAGRARDHGALALLYSVLTVVTFGLYLPLMRNRLAAHLVGNASFGNERFHYDGKEDVLLRRYLLAGVLMVLATAVWAVLVAVASPFAIRFLRGIVVPAMPLLLPIGVAVGATLLLMPVLYAIWLWYRAGELCHFVAHTRLGDARFLLALSAGRYVWLHASNAAALLLSLGLAYPWVTVRRARVLAAALRMDGVLALDARAPGGHDQRPGLGGAEFARASVATEGP